MTTRRVNNRKQIARKQIADWLNNRKIPVSARERVARLARDLGTLSSSVFEWKMPSKFRYHDQTDYIRIAESLAVYRFVPYVYANPVSQDVPPFGVLMVPDIWATSERITTAMKFGRVMEIPTSRVIDSGSVEEQEAWQVKRLIDLSITGEIERLRECRCGKWFDAWRLDKHYCDDACRKKYHGQHLTEEQKKKKRKQRNKYMKNYWKKNPSKRSNSKARQQ
jgi:hypothetical protein